jgi:hypothetical protein
METRQAGQSLLAFEILQAGLFINTCSQGGENME